MNPDELKVLPPLTEKQAKCLEFILDYFVGHRYYPTQREIAAAMGIRSTTAEMYLQPLEMKGYVKRERKKGKRTQRCIRLTRDALERLRMQGVNVEERMAAA